MIASDAKPERHASGQAQEMPRMMLALGLEPALVKLDHPALYAGMESACGQCGANETCRKDLSAQAAAQRFQDYCGNADILERLADRAELKTD